MISRFCDHRLHNWKFWKHQIKLHKLADTSLKAYLSQPPVCPLPGKNHSALGPAAIGPKMSYVTL